RHDGLYWPGGRGEPRSPLGVLVAEAAEKGYRHQGGEGPSPLYGYYFRILEGQGRSARGGAVEYVVDGAMTGGFAVVACPVPHRAPGVRGDVRRQPGRGRLREGPGTGRGEGGRGAHALRPRRDVARAPAGPSGGEALEADDGDDHEVPTR